VTEPVDQRPTNLSERAARGTGVTLLAQSIRILIQFGAVVGLARLLTPEDFGLVAMVTAVIGIADLIRDFGLSYAAISAPTVTEDERTNLFWVNVAIGFGCTLLAMAATPLIVLGYGEDRLTPVVLVLASVFTFSGFVTQFKAGLAREMRFKSAGIADVAAQTISTVVALVMAATGFGLWSLVAQQLVSAASTAAIYAWMSHWWPSWPKRSVSIRKFLRFGLGIFGTQGISYLTKNIDNVAVGGIYGPTALGVYSRAYQLMRMPLVQINAPMTNVALPVLRHVQADDEVFVRYLLRSQLVTCYLTATLFAVAAGLSDPIVAVLFGARWDDVVPIFAVLAVGGVFRAISNVSGWAYMARSATGGLFRQRIFTGTLTIALILAGVPWGPVGVAVGSTVAAAATWLIAVVHAGKVTGVDLWPLITNAARILVVVGTPCGLAAYAGTLVPVVPVLQIVAGTAFAAAYVVLANLILPSVREDLRIALSFVRKALARRRPARGDQPEA